MDVAEIFVSSENTRFATWSTLITLVSSWFRGLVLLFAAPSPMMKEVAREEAKKAAAQTEQAA